MQLRPEHKALKDGRTIFLTRVKPVDVPKRLLQPASNNKKLGGGFFIVARGKWRGVPLYTLTLEERATCSSDCKQWAACFGNNMRFTQRVDHRDPEALQARLETELDEMLRMYRKVLLRLHVLGDFFSVEYTQFWRRMLDKHPGLLIFGFTHWPRASPIGQAVGALNDEDRVWIRFSDQGGPMSANVDGFGIRCPEQTGQTKSCLTCGICWSTTEPVAFKKH